MKILITNDDGIYTDGLWALAEELKEIASVTIVAPDRNQSGSGTSITFHHPLRLSEIKSPLKGISAYSVEGTPADSVILAIRFAIKDKIDLVISGINKGPNLGDDAFISGTVGAARQGYFYGIPSIAVSVAAFEDPHFSSAARFSRHLVNIFGNGGLPGNLLLNVNVPNLPLEEIEGIEITKLGQRKYLDNVEPGHDGMRQYYWIVRGEPEWEVIQGSDIWALKQNKISITPLLNNYDGVDNLLKKLLSRLLEKDS